MATPEKIKPSSHNEWDQLKVVAVGKAEGHQWPTDDLFFNKSIQSSPFPGEFNYNVPQWLIKEAEQDLLQLCELLDKQGVSVIRPKQDSYNARDIMLILGDQVYVAPTPYEYRKNEHLKYQEHLDIDSIIKLPSSESEYFDAANIARFDDKLIYLVSSTGSEQGADLLQHTIGGNYEVIKWKDVYAHAHIDSTMLPLSKDVILCNASRVTEKTLPIFLKDKKKIWVEDVAERDYHKFPYASKWIGCNVLSINPETVVIDSIQVSLKKQLQEHRFEVLTTPMRHSRTLGGGLHCTTLDIIRQN